MKISCVILNYQDGETVEKLVRLIHDYDYLDEIVVVDNGSADDSAQRLSGLADEKVKFLQAEKNGGYGAGNNLGVRYAADHGATHVLIANPDVVFTERGVVRLAKLLDSYPDVGAASAVMEDQTYGDLCNAWRLRGFWGELLAMGPISRRLFRGFLDYPRSFFQKQRAVYVDVLHGSMLMVKAGAFAEAGGYDETIFLYQEEAVLAQRFRTAGYRSALLLTETYQHQHAASIGKNYASQLTRQRMRENSLLYYMKQYLYINPAQEILAKIWFWVIRMEIRLFSHM